jgi:hypothetical protein
MVEWFGPAVFQSWFTKLAVIDDRGPELVLAAPSRFICSRIHLGAVDLGQHASLGNVAVGADPDIEETAVRARCQRLGPVMVHEGRQVGDLDRRAAGAGLSVAVVEADQGIVVGD